MIVNIKNDVFEDIKKNNAFECDGCACGDFYYQLNDKLWITVYRSCRKSSMTPDEKLWQLHDVVFYDNIEFDYFERDGKKYVDVISNFGNCLENVKLNKDDKEKLFIILKNKTKEIWGNEFRNED